MAEKLKIADFIELSSKLPVLDVRTPSEFEQGHIPGAHNLPLFSDDERAEIGTLYTQKSRDASIKRGLEIVGPKMRDFVDEAEKIISDHKVLVHCWRGGMRSESMAWLLGFSGFSPQTLEGGYKAFRNYVLDIFKKPWPIIILGGMTGSGKTEVLHHLKAMGEQVIDLEGLANHKGSAFGALGEDPQPTNEHFENELAMKLHDLDENRPIWLEDESIHIGKNILPKELHQQMRSALVIEMKVPLDERVKHLVNVYSQFPVEGLMASVEKIKRRLGGLRTKQVLQALQEKDFASVAKMALSYYDKTYTYGLNQRATETVYPLPLTSIDHEDNAGKILDYFEKGIKNKVLLNYGNQRN